MSIGRSSPRPCVVVAGHPVAARPGFAPAARRFVAGARPLAPDLDLVAVDATDGESVSQAIARAGARPVVVLPLLMNHGATCDTVRRAAAVFDHVRVCRPLGAAPAIATLARDMALAACGARGWPAARTVLILVAHGAARDPRAQATALRHAARIAATGPFARVDTAFLEAAPMFHDWLARPPRRAAVVGLFLGRGRHVVEDVERPLTRVSPSVAYAGCVGDASIIVDIGLRRIRHALR